jgi:uncharacterized oxidoreductase
MELSNNTVLVTGGASGIGLAIAERFLKAGSEVVICGRRAEKLQEAKVAHPEFHTRVCDLGRAPEREALAVWAVREFPRLNVLVNNAGIQRRVRLADREAWDRTREEIAVNFDAPVHLSRLFIPHLGSQPRAAIINVTSGLSFSPIAAVPVYCATKAALHSFTLSLRHQLKDTPIRVIEIIPPAVDTDLGGPGLHTFGADVNDFADAAIAQVTAGDLEAAYGSSEQARGASPQELDEMFQRMNAGRG